MIKYGHLDNWQVDEIALNHGHAYTLVHPDGREVVVTTKREVEDFKRQGWIHRWTLNKSDFGPDWQ